MEQNEPASGGSGKSAVGGVQSIERVFELLEAMADLGGIVGLSQLAAASGLPLPTIHRLIRTLVDLGYVRQEPSRKYALGPRLMRLGEYAGRLFGTWAIPYLRDLADELGESANLALLDVDGVVFVAQAQGSHSLRMFTEAGRRRGVHCTAVGKAILAGLPDDRVGAILARIELKRFTERTITDPDLLMKELASIRMRGYATDEGEQDIGVRCVGVVLPSDPARAAVSISGPVTRMTDELVDRAVPLLQRAAESLATELEMVTASSVAPAGFRREAVR